MVHFVDHWQSGCSNCTFCQCDCITVSLIMYTVQLEKCNFIFCQYECASIHFVAQFHLLLNLYVTKVLKSSSIWVFNLHVVRTMNSCRDMRSEINTGHCYVTFRCRILFYSQITQLQSRTKIWELIRQFLLPKLYIRVHWLDTSWCPSNSFP